jgi:hypothetical protein
MLSMLSFINLPVSPNKHKHKHLQASRSAAPHASTTAVPNAPLGRSVIDYDR